jgi:ActR/RegA family two-component response regulator
MPETRVLFVDDDEVIRKLLTLRLRGQGYDVMAAESVGEAISLIGSRPFDVLVTDLNIGQPGDGFTVVSAMRRTQPGAVTIILTGYPDFETALNAIRNQVDDYIAKPPDLDALVRTIEACREKRRAGTHAPANKRVADIIEENLETISEQWLSMVTQDAGLSGTSLPAEYRTAYVPAILADLVKALRTGRETVRAGESGSATGYGQARRAQGCAVTELIEESRLLQRAVYNALQTHLLAVDLSWLIPDMVRVSDSLQRQLILAVEAYSGS